MIPDSPMHITSRRLCLGIAGGMVLALATAAHAQEPSEDTTPARQQRPAPGIGFDAFGGAGITWPAAADSIEAVGLESRSVEFGGGARVTGLWRQLFAQVALFLPEISLPFWLMAGMLWRARQDSELAAVR